MPNLYYCSDGSRVSETAIRDRYRKAKEKRFEGYPAQICRGCGTMCAGCAHTIARARCKVLHKTELIWDPANFWPACHACNQAIENPKGEGWKDLINIGDLLDFIEKHDPELYTKFVW